LQLHCSKNKQTEKISVHGIFFSDRILKGYNFINATRQLLALPFSVVFSEIGLVSPMPLVVSLAIEISTLINRSLTAFSRYSDSVSLCKALMALSVNRHIAKGSFYLPAIAVGDGQIRSFTIKTLNWLHTFQVGAKYKVSTRQAVFNFFNYQLAVI
jgi:hypothetical protein